VTDTPCARFILRYSGPGEAPNDVLQHLQCLSGAKILDRTPRMLLVQGDGDRLRSIVAQCPHWLMSADVDVPVPDARMKRDD
jgi:hypothetical protein